MLSSLSPVGEHTRGQRWWVTTASSVVASTLGGATTGLLVGTVGALTIGPVTAGSQATPRIGALAVAIAILVLLERRDHLPTVRRQVDERWLTTYRGWVYGAGYGYQLGLGVVTIASALTYATFAAGALTGSAALGAAIGATFGAVRGVPLLLTRKVITPTDLRALMARVASLAPDRGLPYRRGAG